MAFWIHKARVNKNIGKSPEHNPYKQSSASVWDVASEAGPWARTGKQTPHPPSAEQGAAKASSVPLMNLPGPRLFGFERKAKLNSEALWRK